MATSNIICITEVEFPPGLFRLAASEIGLCYLAFPKHTETSFYNWIKQWCPDHEIQKNEAFFQKVIEQLKLYFAGELREFNIPLDLRTTPFHKQVLDHVAQIPYGETTTYGDIANKLNLTNGARAVGSANGANPIPVIIPCHRVIGSEGKLTGFGGGLPLKCELLRLEGHHIVDNRIETNTAQLSLFG